MWACAACSYNNIRATATKCHICGTIRSNANAAVAPAIIDLTNGCSPKRQPNGGSMESNRRQRRLEEKCDAGDGRKRSNHVDKSITIDDSSYLSHLSDNNGAAAGVKNEGTNSLGAPKSCRFHKPNHQDVLEILSSDEDVEDSVSKSLRSNHSKYTSMTARADNSQNRKRKQKEEREKKQGSTRDKKISMTRDIDTSSSILLTDNSCTKTNPNASNNYKEVKKPRATSNEKENKNCLTDFYSKQLSLPIETLMQQARTILKERFGHSTLRSLQETAIHRSFERTNQIIIMATGGGKSICYQLPAIVGFGKRAHNCVTIVVCPLIALMVDQVRNLHKKGVMTAACLSSSQTAKEKAEIYSRICFNKDDKSKANVTKPLIQLLYVTPELIKTEKFRAVLHKLYEADRLFQFAVDEAHCVSTWGHDFRVAYKELSWLREAFPDVPVMACTGTATAKVINDIRDILRLDVQRAPCIMGTFNRTNISYEGDIFSHELCRLLKNSEHVFLTDIFSTDLVRFKDSLNETTTDGALLDLSKLVQEQHEISKKANEPCSGIVYVHKREDCVTLAVRIAKMTGLVCAPYHAGLKDSTREETQQKWTDGSIHIAVATVAFGMGIDLAHVRYVIHWTMAKSLEGFYQESGRAGRDGKPSLSALYYSKDDADKFAYIIQKKSDLIAHKTGNFGTIRHQADNGLVELEGMIDYCTKPRCRRKHVMEHFGEQCDPKTQCKKTCDFCKNPEKVEADTKAAECMTNVINSQRVMCNTGWDVSTRNEQPFHRDPFESDRSQDDEYESDGFMGTDEGMLGIHESAGDNSFVTSDPPTTNGFIRASAVAVLRKYEKLESETGEKSGFMNSKMRIFNHEDGTKKQHVVEIPAHLRGCMPDPHPCSYTKPNQEIPKSQRFYESEAARIRAELDENKRELEAARAKMLECGGGISKATSSTLPVPSLSFKKRH